MVVLLFVNEWNSSLKYIDYFINKHSLTHLERIKRTFDELII